MMKSIKSHIFPLEKIILRTFKFITKNTFKLMSWRRLVSEKNGKNYFKIILRLL